MKKIKVYRKSCNKQKNKGDLKKRKMASYTNNLIKKLKRRFDKYILLLQTKKSDFTKANVEKIINKKGV